MRECILGGWSEWVCAVYLSVVLFFYRNLLVTVLQILCTIVIRVCLLLDFDAFMEFCVGISSNIFCLNRFFMKTLKIEVGEP